MSNIFSKLRLRFQKRKPSAVRERREQIRTLEAIAVVFETLDRFAEGNLLYYDKQRQMVVISHVLANFYLYDEKDWQTFLGNVHQWAVFKYTSEEYARLYNVAMADACAKAYASGSNSQLARLEAAAAFDDEQASRQITAPDMQFVIIGDTDGQPIIVAARKGGRYETYPVSTNQ